MSRRTTRSLHFMIAAAAVLSMAGPAYAKGGATGGGGTGGGGGTPAPAPAPAPAVGVIKSPVSAVAPCDGATSLNVTVQKGNNKVVQQVLLMTGPTAGWWDFSLTEDSTGRGLVVFGGTEGDLIGVTSVRTTSTGSTLAPGTWNLSFLAQHRDAQFSPVIETCSAHVTVIAV